MMRDYSGDRRFLTSAFGREFLPYIFGIQGGKMVKVPIGVVRKPMTGREQERWLPSNSIAIISHCALHQNKSKKYPFCDKVKLVCTPFSEVPNSWRKKVPHFQLCESDMVDKCWVSSKNYRAKTKAPFKKKYDIFIITEFNKKGLRYKGLQILYFLLDIEKELGLRVCILDTATKRCWKNDLKSPSLGSFIRDVTSIVKRRSKRSDLLRPRHGRHGDFLGQGKMNGLMHSSRCLLVGNINDASPKIITEALIRGVPVVLNKHILGGGKYIDKYSGSLFDGGESPQYIVDNYDMCKESLFSALNEVLSGSISSKEIIRNYYKKWGLKNSSKKLAKSINKEFGTSYSHVFYPQFKKYFR